MEDSILTSKLDLRILWKVGALVIRTITHGGQITDLQSLIATGTMTSATNFRPHGLIKTRMQQQFYNKAHIANIYTGIADPKEHETVALMEVVLYKNIFTEDYSAATSEQPASLESQRHCEIVIKYLENESESIRTLCFAECKRTRKSQAFSLKALEEQAADYCKLYVEYERVPFVYAATMAGAHVRLWKYMLGDERLTPLWGENHEGDWQEYKDIGNEEDGQLVEESFNQMKAWTPTPHAGQTISSYTSYQPANSSSYSTSSNPVGYTASYNNPAETSSRYAPSYNAQTDPQGGYAAPSTYEGADPTEASSSYTQNQYGDALGDSSAWNDTGNMGGLQEGTGGGRESDYMVVKVTRVPHMTRLDEFTFRDRRGHRRTTTKLDWTKTTYGGKDAWLYQGHSLNYVTHDKIPT
ncbi:hypothetical protein B7463_g10056, partial [Scytalidium lignicola]